MAFTNVLLLKISSTIYYSSISEAVITFIIMTAAMAVSLLTFIHTIYKFFCEQITDGSPPKLNSTDVSSGRGRSNSATRSHIPSRGGSLQPKRAHSKQISFLIAALTIFYLFNASLYTVSNWLIRLLSIFFSIYIHCAVLAYLQIGYVLIKASFYVLFIVRLHLMFDNTSLAVKPLILKLICICSIVLLALAFIFFLIDIERQFKAAGYDCSQNIVQIESILPAVIVDTVTKIILLYLFVNKLSQLIRVQTSSMESFSRYDNSTLRRIKNLVLIMTKLTVLVCVYIIGNWVMLFLFLPILPGSAAVIDIAVGNICVIFCYEFHKKNYDKYCFPCKFFCFHSCFWWFIICKEESNALRRLTCSDICCPEKSQQRKTVSKCTQNDKKEVILSTNDTEKDAKKEDEVEHDDTIEAMMMTQISIKKQTSTQTNEDKDNVGNAIQHNMTDVDIIYSQDTEREQKEDLEDIAHEKRSTFIINLNVENGDSIFKNVEQHSPVEEEEEEEDDCDLEIKKSETNTFDYRAGRLMEMHQLFFGDEFDYQHRRRRMKEEEEKNRKLMGKTYETDYKIHDDGDDEKENRIDHKVKKSKTAI